MNQEDFRRKLTAILSADVEGYSRLMGEDEDSTIRTLTTYRELMSTLIQKHRGRVVDSPGDNLLAEFGSVVDAVRCAVEIQEELRVRNAELPENRRMEFRIGINLGDVVEEGERIYGDGVNITARVEGLAEGGGICISGTVYDSIKNKLSLSYESLGEHTVKNIAEPVRVYRMRIGPEAAAPMEREEKKKPRRWRWAAIGGAAVLIVIAGGLAIWNYYFRVTVEPASLEKMAYKLPDKPSIAVMAFTNMSGDPEQEYFSDGLSEEIITTLSKVSDLFVIARQSTFSYKGKPVKIKQVAEELGVQYVLEGSVRKDEKRVRITAQLIDALTGHHLWAETYDQELKGIFAVQDEIKKKIITALEVKLTMGEQARLFAKGTDNVEAWALGAKAWKIFSKYSRENNLKARQLLERAIKLDPNYPFLWMALASTHFVDARLAWTKSQAESLKRAVKFSEKTLNLDPENPFVHGLMGNVYLFQRQYEKAIAEGQRAISLDPNFADGYAMLSQIMLYSGRFEEALELIKKAIRLSPIHRAFYTVTLANALLMSERYEDTIPVSKQLIERWRRRECPPSWGHTSLIMAYMGLGREEEARAVAEELLRIAPTYSLERWPKINPYKDSAHLERMLSPLREAGLPEKPPLPLPDKPSIAVLPFVNMSGDPEQEYFSDGITEEIITALSKTPKLFVIARTSSFKYKGKKVDVRMVGRELGVRYVLEGSFRKAGDKVRITAQLADAKTRNHVWAQRYDRDLKDIFALQDEITMKIITAMQVNLTRGEQARLWEKGTDNLEAYLKFLKGRELYGDFTQDDLVKARQSFEEAIALDPEYPDPYIDLGHVHIHEARLGMSKSPKKSTKKAFELAKKALALDETHPRAHALLGFIYLRKWQYEEGIVACERAVALSPNDVESLSWLGLSLSVAGRPQEAIPYLEKAIRLNPVFPMPATFFLGDTYRVMGQCEKAMPHLKKALHYRPKAYMILLNLAACYTELEREEEARSTVTQILKLNPKFSLERFAGQMAHRGAVKERFLDNLRKAGLK